MKTPRNNPQVLEEWKKLEKDYIKEGLSQTASREKIAQKYKTTRHTVSYWLDPEHRKRMSSWWRNYSKKKNIKENRKKYFRTRHISIKATVANYKEIDNELDNLTQIIFGHRNQIGESEFEDRISDVSSSKQYLDSLYRLLSSTKIYKQNGKYLRRQ